MINADINPQGMVDLFKRFEKIEADSTGSSLKINSSNTWQKATWKKAGQLLSTHPSPDNRIEYLERALQGSAERDFQSRKSLEDLFKGVKGENDSLHSKI